MALKHYGGSTPAGPSEWTCPSCQAVNTVPLKAGCQSCGAGGDARKVGAPSVTVDKPRAMGPTETQYPSVYGAKAALDWMRATDRPLDQGTPWANSEEMQEAFMAGVAWAQAQQAQVLTYAEATAVPLNTPDPDWDDPKRPLTLWIEDTKHQDRVDEPTLGTILAALAFYRDNVLGYGGMPGQLTAEQVTELITRLSPQEQDA